MKTLTDNARDRAVEVLALLDRRDAILGGNLFGDPSWAMLLDLFIQSVDGRVTTVTDMCSGSRAPATTALRHLARLEREELVCQVTDSEDRRKKIIRLTRNAFDKLGSLLSD